MTTDEQTVTTENKELHSLEDLRPEVRNIEGFQGLFEVDTERLNKEFERPLQEAPGEVAEIIISPLQRASNFLKNEKLNPLVKDETERQFKNGIEALTFFNDFCEDLNGIDAYDVLADPDPSGGIKLTLRPGGNYANWGVIGSEVVDKVEIIIRDGTQVEEDAEAYTPMQLNFRFSHKTHEITSLRMDMHNRQENSVQVDAIVGGDRMDVRHEDVASLNEGDHVRNFRAMQGAFLLNFASKHLVRRNDEGKYDTVEGLSVTPESRPHIIRVIKECQKAEKYLYSPEIT